MILTDKYKCAAWEEWCDALKTAGSTLLSPGCPDDPFTQAEGYRYLTRLVRASLEVFVECSDVDAPVFFSISNGSQTAPVKIGSDNPDDVYQAALLSGKKQYVVKIIPGDVKYLGFGSQSGVFGSASGMTTIDYKTSEDFEKKDNGEFEIFLSNERPAGVKNWLRTSSSSDRGLLIVRQLREDHANSRLANISIEIVGGSKTPSPCSAEGINDALSTSASFVMGVPLLFSRWAHGFQKHINELPPFDQKIASSFGGDLNIRYYHSYWRLTNQEALIVYTKLPKVATWNFQLNNHWMESLDYRYYDIHVNPHTAKYRDDNSVVIVVCASNVYELPDSEKALPFKWLTIADHTCGTMCFRWIRPESFDDLPDPKTKVVKLDNLMAELSKPTLVY